jgi:hypothetical protein
MRAGSPLVQLQGVEQARVRQRRQPLHLAQRLGGLERLLGQYFFSRATEVAPVNP